MNLVVIGMIFLGIAGVVVELMKKDLEIQQVKTEDAN